MRDKDYSVKAAFLSWAQMAVYTIIAVTGTAIIIKLSLHQFIAVKIIWLIIIVASFILVVIWQTKSISYKCLKCGHKFDISAWTNFIIPGLAYKYFIKCPQCQKRTTAVLINKIKKQEI